MINHFLKAMMNKKPPQINEGPAIDLTGQSHDLELYYFKSCPFCQKVLSRESELKVPMVFKDIKENQSFEKELISIGGKKQVPCLLIDGKPLYESNDIVDYLNENYTH